MTSPWSTTVSVNKPLRGVRYDSRAPLLFSTRAAHIVSVFTKLTNKTWRNIMRFCVIITSVTPYRSSHSNQSHCVCQKFQTATVWISAKRSRFVHKRMNCMRNVLAIDRFIYARYVWYYWITHAYTRMIGLLNIRMKRETHAAISKQH